MLYRFEAFILWHRFFVPLTFAVFDVWGRLAETGTGNKWRLVAFRSARLDQLGDLLTFCKGLRFLFYGTAYLSH